VGEEQPGTEDWLGEDVEDSVGDDLAVNVGNAGAISDTPDDWVDGPDDEGETTDGSEEVADLAALVHGSTTTVDDKDVDEGKEGNAGHGVPAPLLRSTLAAESGEKTGKDHDDVGNDDEESVSSRETGKKAEIEEEERSGQGPVNVTGPVDLTVDILGGVWDVLVALGDLGVVVGDTVAGGLVAIRTRSFKVMQVVHLPWRSRRG